MSEASRSHRGQRDRNGGGNRGGDTRRPRQYSSNRSSPPQHSARASSSNSQQRRGAPSNNSLGSSCTHMCSRRGVVLLCAFLTNLLVLFCVVAAQVTLSGMSAMNFGGGDFASIIIPFEGTELQQVLDLDMQYGQMRAPGVYGGVAFSLTFGIVSLFFVISGNKPPHLLSRKLLIGQFAFQVIGAVAYVIAVGLYLHLVIRINSTDVCKARERLYARNGMTWMNCSVNGADASVALFGILTVILFSLGSFFTFRTIQNVKRYSEENVHYEAERPAQRSRPQNSTRQSDIYI